MEDHGNKLGMIVLALTSPIWGTLLLAAFLQYQFTKAGKAKKWRLML
jgi:hypothetical protein